MSSSLPTPILNQADAVKELLELARAVKGSDGQVEDWVKELEGLTTSLSSPDFKAIKLLFGKSKAHPIYDIFPPAALTVTAAFIRTCTTNRLGKYLSKPNSDLTLSERKTKTHWEDVLIEIIASVGDWCEWSDDKKAKSHVGSSLYRSLGPLLTNASSKRLSVQLKKTVLELFESTLSETRGNRTLFIDPGGQAVMNPKKLGELLLTKPVHQASHLLSLDIAAHCLPKQIDDRKKYSSAIFFSLSGTDVANALETLLNETKRSDWNQTRIKILKLLVMYDSERLALFPLVSATRSSTGTRELLGGKDDRDLLKMGMKWLYLDSTSVCFNINEKDGRETTVATNFDQITATNFEREGSGDDTTTTALITDSDGETFKYTLKCSQDSIQRVCASRGFRTAVPPPPTDMRSFQRASTMERGIQLPSPDASQREPVPPDNRSSLQQSSQRREPKSSQSAVRPRDERFETMERFTIPSSKSPKSPEGGGDQGSSDEHSGSSPPERKPRSNPKRVTALAKTSVPLSKDLFGDSGSELSDTNSLSTGGRNKKPKSTVDQGFKRKRVALEEDEEINRTVVPKKKKPSPASKSNRKEVSPPEVGEDEPASAGFSASLPPPPPKQSVPIQKYGASLSATATGKKKQKSIPLHSVSTSKPSERLETLSPVDDDSDKENKDQDDYDALPTSDAALANPISKKRETKAQAAAKGKRKKPAAVSKPKAGATKKKVLEENTEGEDTDSELSSTPERKKKAVVSVSTAKKGKKTPAVEEPPAKKESKLKIMKPGPAKTKEEQVEVGADVGQKGEKADTSGSGTRTRRKTAVEARKKLAAAEKNNDNYEEKEEGEEEEAHESLSVLPNSKQKEKEKEKERTKEPRAEPPAEKYAYLANDDGFANDDGDATMVPTKALDIKPKIKMKPALGAISERGELDWMSDAGRVRRAESGRKLSGMPASIKKKKSTFAPWEDPLVAQQKLDEYLAAEGMKGILEENRSDISASEAPYDRAPSYREQHSPPRSSKNAAASRPEPMSQAPSTTRFTGSRLQKTGTQVIDSEEEDIQPLKMVASTRGRRSRRNSSAAAHEPFAPLAHSTPKPLPETPKNPRALPNTENVVDVPPFRETSKQAVGASKTTTGFGRSDLSQLPKAQQSSSKKASVPIELGGRKTANRLGAEMQGQEDVGVDAGPTSSARKKRHSSVARSEDGVSLVKETFDVIASELSRRYLKRVKRTQLQAKDVQTRLTSDTQKLAAHLVTRTGLIVEASRKHRGVMKDLNTNIASNTHDAKLKSQNVAKDLQKALEEEGKNGESWPERFFA